MGTPVELCIVGAGVAGLNALVVASEYLTSRDTVVLVDSHPEPGGMWLDTYDYVRLHQPHRIFTAGSVAWQPKRAQEHLASRREILAHLARCRDVAAGRVALDQRLGWNYVSHREVGDLVEVTLAGPDGITEVVLTKRLIKAFGNHVTSSEPLAVQSTRVHSLTPETLDLQAAPTAPVWVVGGGKTAMDTIHAVVSSFPGREVHLVAGPGTFFARREAFFPTGAARWWRGRSVNTLLREVCRRFDGTNEVAVREWYRERYAVCPVDGATAFLSAYLSEDESRVIRAGLHTVVRDYLDDVVDTDCTPELLLRSGRRVAVPAGTLIVNCTGLLLRDRHDYEPAVSPSGRVLSIQQRASLTGPFSAFGGYYLTHLMMLGRLHQADLYELDLEALADRSREALIFASFTLASYNLGQISRAVPMSVLLRCGLDYDRWYPPHRQLAGAVAFLATRGAMVEHNRRTLDALGRRFEVRCGPLAGARVSSSTS